MVAIESSSSGLQKPATPDIARWSSFHGRAICPLFVAEGQSQQPRLLMTASLVHTQIRMKTASTAEVWGAREFLIFILELSAAGDSFS